MSSLLDQKNRVAELTTDLGQNVLALSRFEAQEGLSETFEFVVDCVSEDENVDFDKIIGRGCLVKVRSFERRTRCFHGILTDAVWNGIREGFYSYRLVLRPWFWLLSHRADCRFFQEMTVPDIIKKVFQDAGFGDFEEKLSGSYPQLEYCVQYRESDFAFLSRLMEEYGIYYFFKHSEDRHVMVLVDSPSAHEAPPCGDLPFVPLTGAYIREEEHLQHWNSERRFRSGKFVVNDYDFERPSAKIEANAQGVEKYDPSKLEVYDYPARYKERGVGDTLARIKLDAEQSLDHRRTASGEAVSVYAGSKITVTGHHSEPENGDYLVVRATHVVAEQSYRSSGQAGSFGKPYQGSYVLTPYDRQFRAPLLTPKPIVHGVQTAKVVGEPGEEITVDKYGRIKVQFHWDRKHKQSCWIRVAEVWAGKSWGGVFHPRVDQEVVVDFLEGDPDRPLVVGTLYNAENMPPYPLPGEKTKGGLKSNSTVGGGGYNEFIFEDKKGSEKIRMHGEKDHEVVIRNSEKRTIGEAFKPPRGSASREVTIKNGDDKLTVSSGCQEISVKGDRTVNITGNDKLDVTMACTIEAKLMLKLTCGATSITLTPAALMINSPAITITSPGLGLVVNAPAGGVLVNASTLINGKAPAPPLVGGKLIIG